MANYPTPHINAKPEDFAKTVLMPGDPLRSAFVAKEFLEGAVLVNNVRGVQGYTGTYKGEKVSVNVNPEQPLSEDSTLIVIANTQKLGKLK